MSFYRNFTDKDDILRYYIDTETGKWLESSDINYLTAGNPQVYVIFLLEHLYQYRDVIDTMMRDGKMYLLEAEFDKRFRAILSDVFDPWYIAFTIGGFYKLFCYWAESGYEKTPQEIAEYVKAIPHNPCASDVKSVFSSECINLTLSEYLCCSLMLCRILFDFKLFMHLCFVDSANLNYRSCYCHFSLSVQNSAQCR